MNHDSPAHLASDARLPSLGSLARRIPAAQPALFRTGIALIAMAALCLPGLVLDHRLFNGVSVWLKPVKFQLSVGLYLVTLAAYFLALPPGSDRGGRGRYVVWASVAAGLFEVAYITLQAARGQASHWNVSSLAGSVMYGLMGLGAVVLTSTAFVLGLMIHRDRGRPLDPTLRLALVVGLTMTFVLGAGFGGYMSSTQGHGVGGTLSDAGGLPVFAWSRDGGDLRVAHFFGIHAMHLVPAFAWLAVHRSPPARARLATLAFALLLAALTVGTFVQALLGRPFLRL